MKSDELDRDLGSQRRRLTFGRFLRRSAWRILSFFVLIGLAILLFRSVFSQGQLITPDFFLIFPAVATSHGLTAYLSQWNSGALGYSSSLITGYGLISMLTTAGFPVAAVQPAMLVLLASAGAISMQLLIEPYLSEPKLALVGGALFLLSPYFFVDVFNASSSIPFDFLIPLLLLFGIRIGSYPKVSHVVGLSLTLGFIFAFVPFGPVYFLPIAITFPITFGLIRRSLRVGIRTLLVLAAALTTGIVLNAPYFIGNLPYFGSNSLQPKYAAAVSIIPSTYAYSTPTHIFSLLGGGLYPRYSAFYPPIAEASLILFAAVALVGLLFTRSLVQRELRTVVTVLLISCFSWVILTAAQVTIPVYQSIGFLTALNFPGALYAYLTACLTVLATLTLDSVRTWGLNRQSQPTFSSGGFASGGQGGRRTKAGRLFAKLSRPKTRTVISIVIISILLVFPSSFYLESGDMKVFEAPGSFGFPPQWGATIPSAYPAMYDFLQSHSAAFAGPRFLILPFPGFEGGLQFGPFATNTFGLTEYEGQTGAANLFFGPRSSEFATSVLNYLLANRTNQIGVLLGEASVLYVLVDLQANFTESPQWVFGSLVGSPQAFLNLLSVQRDLQLVYRSGLFVVFQNLDYRPLVTGAAGAVVVSEGQPSVNLNHSVAVLQGNPESWSIPLPSGRISSIERTSSGYAVEGVNKSGLLDIAFSNSTDSISGATNGLNGSGLYLLSNPIQVNNQFYSLQFNQQLSAPQGTLGSYVSISGYDSSGRYLWGIASFSVAPASQPYVEVPFEPVLLNDSTTYIEVAIAFPYDLGNPGLASYTVANMSLILSLPSMPSQFLAPLFLSELPSYSLISQYAAVPDFDYSEEAQSSFDDAHVPVRYLCIGLCSQSTNLSDQLYFAYSSLETEGNNASYIIDQDALAGESVRFEGASVNATLLVNPSPLHSVALRVEGNGSVSIESAGGFTASFAVNSSLLKWYSYSFQGAIHVQSLLLSFHGSISVDSVWLGSLPLDLTETNPVPTVSITGSTLTDYSGQIGADTALLVLSQGFNSEWVASVAGFDSSATIVAGWENGFATAYGPTESNNTYQIQFEGQQQHIVFLAVQIVALVVLVVLAVILGISGLRARALNSFERSSARLTRGR